MKRYILSLILLILSSYSIGAVRKEAKSNSMLTSVKETLYLQAFSAKDETPYIFVRTVALDALEFFKSKKMSDKLSSVVTHMQDDLSGQGIEVPREKIVEMLIKALQS